MATRCASSALTGRLTAQLLARLPGAQALRAVGSDGRQLIPALNLLRALIHELYSRMHVQSRSALLGAALIPDARVPSPLETAPQLLGSLVDRKRPLGLLKRSALGDEPVLVWRPHRRNRSDHLQAAAERPSLVMR